jgi:CHRD domain-containing protein
MRRYIVGTFAALAIIGTLLAPMVTGDSPNRFTASLNGFLETPSVSTSGRGSISVRIDGNTIHYRLTYSGLTAAPLFAHIHFGRPDVAGGVAAFLCGGSTKPAACPASGTVTGTIVAADVVGPGDQGIAPGQYGEFVRAIRAGAAYANVHTPMFGSGEIRGNLRRAP